MDRFERWMVAAFVVSLSGYAVLTWYSFAQ
jgi:hypothetical protein